MSSSRGIWTFAFLAVPVFVLPVSPCRLPTNEDAETAVAAFLLGRRAFRSFSALHLSLWTSKSLGETDKRRRFRRILVDDFLIGILLTTADNVLRTIVSGHNF
uniref:Putative secreted protein n=1 Tax=Ixodes ricinus TaxID=34613 RepID=A0A6B0UCQ1_IXORI